ncbi:MAG: glycoside hydrolase family 43 protein, partial [Chloroflexota bacterium]|nr:glycoside hydrolase family 43 protein [Chloroflexota bacterium]
MTYLNPLYSRNFPDPFVLKHLGEYWAYCTGFWHDGRCFGILHSRDLIHWRELAGAMEPLPGGATCYWAPEVTYDNGRFYLYYSVGNEERMQIRVGVAEHPAGPFVDSGHRLTSELFAIDPHVFEDEGGIRYLFYATDFLDRERVGTGTVRDRLLDPFTLEGKPQPVTLPCYDWQIYDPHRVEKGGVCWHTVEGPFVLKHKGLYYQMFSGGNWQNPSYGVSYATTDSITRSEEWVQICDGEHVLPILRTVPGQVIGPGHNSAVRGPDNQQLFCVYHGWAEDGSGRLLAIDRLEWVGERMLVLGPSYTSRPAPLLATFADYFDAPRTDGLGPDWTCVGGRWSVRDRAAIQESIATAEARCATSAPCFVAEVSVRAVGRHDKEAAYGISLLGERGTLLSLRLLPEGRQAVLTWHADSGWREQKWALPDDFKAESYHLLRFEINQQLASLVMEGAHLQWSGRIQEENAYRVALYTEEMAAAFAGFALTIGWQDEFTHAADPAELGWHWEGPADNWHIENGQLAHHSTQEPGRLIKGCLLDVYELVVNVRLESDVGDDVAYGFYPALGEDGDGPLLAIERDQEGWAMQWHEQGTTRRFPLPREFDPFVYQQFRFRKEGGRLMLQWEEQVVGEGEVSPHPARVGLYAAEALVA